MLTIFGMEHAIIQESNYSDFWSGRLYGSIDCWDDANTSPQQAVREAPVNMMHAQVVCLSLRSPSRVADQAQDIPRSHWGGNFTVLHDPGKPVELGKWKEW